MSEYRPAGETFGTLELAELPEGLVPVEAIVLTRCVGADGSAGWYFRWSQGMASAVDRFGPLTAFLRADEYEIAAMYEPCADEEEED